MVNIISYEKENKKKLEPCRLCQGKTQNKFLQKILGKFEVNYYKCIDCGSLQTETPYWMNEAYKINNLNNTDTGAVQRNLHNLSMCYLITKILRAKNVLDIGGGDGLLCRLLRDYKINCFVKDKYATPTYGQGFTEQNFNIPDLILAFEVMEHYTNPNIELEKIFSYKPKAVLISTLIYTNQNQDWWYLAPESGQHLFFYTKKAIEIIAFKYDYKLIMSGGYILFVKSANIWLKIASKILMNGRIVRLFKCIIILLPTPGVRDDYLLQVQKSKQEKKRNS
jgi:2-polyprenyl-3-methyl-5-hydroxy-6-metoxy-1,4-benzoquinol methylase